MPRPRLSRTLLGVMLTMTLSTFALVPAAADPEPPAPVITWNSLIADGASFVFGQVPAVPTCTAVDGAGAVLPCTIAGYGTTVGPQVLTASASDLVTTTLETRSYTVESWTLKGFHRPVKMGEGVWNKAKAGSTVPLKFKVFEGATKAKAKTVVAAFTAQQINCTDLSPIGLPLPLASNHKGRRLKFRDGAFHQNWKTPKLTKAQKHVARAEKKTAKASRKVPASTICYQVTMTTLDGSALAALFTLK